MSKAAYLIFHKDFPISVHGVNSGAEMATLGLARALAFKGHRVVLCAELRGPETTDRGVEFWDLGSDYNVGKLIRRAREIGPYHLLAACRAQPILESRDESTCLTRHLMAHDPSSAALGVKPSVVTQIADGIVCVSEAQRSLFVEAGAEPSKVRVIYNGADLDLFGTGDPNSRDYKKILFVGALVQDKGIDILLHAYAAIKARHPSASLDIYGSASMWGREPLFNERAIEAQLPGVKFHGGVSQNIVAEAFKKAGMCVIASRWFDSFPLTAVEAQVTGCPVVAFDVGGVRESFSPGETGVLVSEVSEAKLAQALDSLLSSPKELERLSKNALRIARARFSWSRTAEQVIALSGGSVKSTKTMPRVGLVSTWNQPCGLSTYAGYLFESMPQGSYTVFAEKVSSGLTRADQSFVRRVWSRKETDVSELGAAISESKLDILHLNLQAGFLGLAYFSSPAFSGMLRQVRAQGVSVVTHLHNVFTSTPVLERILSHSDRVIVHSAEVGLEAVAAGADPDRVSIIPHGVSIQPELTPGEKNELRTKLKLPLNEKIVVAFGFMQPHKGMEGVIEAVAHLGSKNIPARGCLVGSPNVSDPNSAEYINQLRQYSERLGVQKSIEFRTDKFISDSEVTSYLRVADVVLMNYHSQYFESSGACSLAVGAGAVVATSIAPAFNPFGDAVWHITTGFPVTRSVELLLSRPALSQKIKAQARAFAQTHSWPNMARKFQDLYFKLLDESNASRKETVVETKQPTMNNSRSIRVLMQNRPNAYTQRGGDTSVMDRLASGLRARGVEVTIDLEAKADPAQFDLVHLFNFCLPEYARALAERAHRAGVPYVVTTLAEDISAFHNQSISLAQKLIEYVKRGQDSNWWTSFRSQPVDPCGNFDNVWTAQHAAALMVSGETEGDVIRSAYPNCGRIVETKFGCEVGAAGDPETFAREYGVRDFVLSVGRIESRKNQLLLLKALEHSDLTVVLAGGGFTYQPEYDRAVRSFKRRGKTIVLGRVSPEMLASAYAAAKVHVLPSWYELPGLVSLEAATYGCNVVTTDRGTARDYFGSTAIYCDPSSEESIRNAVMAAYYAPTHANLKNTAGQFSWNNLIDVTYNTYAEIASRRGLSQAASLAQPMFAGPAMGITPSIETPSSRSTPTFESFVDDAEKAVKAGDYNRAQELLTDAEKLFGQSARILRVKGAIYLAQDKLVEAGQHFERARKIDPSDARAVSGLGMIQARGQNYQAAYPLFVEALKLDPSHLGSIYYLVECAYNVGKFDDLVSILQAYVSTHPTDPEMQFCLAGALYKSGNQGAAAKWVEQILSTTPQHTGAMQLRDVMRQESGRATQAPQANENTAQKASSGQANSGLKPEVVVQTGASPGLATANDSASGWTQFDPIDQRLSELEELKRNRKIEEAKSACQEVLKNMGISAKQKERATLLFAELCVQEGELEVAQNTFVEVLTNNPRSARALCGQGALKAHAGNWADARKLFSQALECQPNFDVALAGLGLCAYYSQQPEMAWDFYRQALASNPENLRALLGLIEIGYPMKRLAEVEIALKTYLDMHPLDLEFLYSLAGCLFAQNKIEEAGEAVRNIVLFEPQHKNALELQQMIVERQGMGAATNR